MPYISVKQAAAKWNLSERSVRNYCAEGRIPDAVLTGKTWNIPATAKKPIRINHRIDKSGALLTRLKEEKK